ncbi:MAG TPA: response regulator [Verrucomicrobiae bacterium]
MKKPLHILHLEDNLNDAALIQSALKTGGIACATTRVQNRADFVAALERGGIDLIFSDFSLPAFDGLSAAKIVRAQWPDIPLILVSGTVGEELAIDSLKSGATDYVLKERLARLVPAVHRAMEESEERVRRRLAEETAGREQIFLEAALNSLPGVFYVFDESLKFLRWNKNFEKVSGYSSEEFARLSPTDVFTGPERDYIAGKIKEVFTAGFANAEAFLTARDGTKTPYYFTGHRIELQGKVCLIGMGIDITERRRLEAQFIEAQKMQTIGQLAGGVAHDFNNILGIIMGYSGLMMPELAPGSLPHKCAEEIQEAAERAAALTRQLLIFSRKQNVQPVVLDLNAVVADMDKMLRRLIDEGVELAIDPGKNIGRIRADAGHIGQVLMNLVINARDAMPNGGKLTIATSDVTLEEKYARTYADAAPGNYVMLSVRDTGTGMTDEVKGRLFEAFFTTKPKGKGTGLGLATCQTILKQCGGHIGVESTLGQGATFKIYFPRVDLPLEKDTEFIKKGPLPRGTETLLLVEDESSVRHLACSILEKQGYIVLRANNGQEGLRVANECKGQPIRLVVTDVIMPQMGGKVMAEWLKSTYPGIKILFTSGYMDDVIAHHGVLEPDVAFLPKPYTPAALTRKVREMLDAK